MSNRTVGQNNVPWNASDRTFGLEAVHPLRSFQVEPYFVHVSSYESYPPKLTPKVTKRLSTTTYLKIMSPCKQKHTRS